MSGKRCIELLDISGDLIYTDRNTVRKGTMTNKVRAMKTSLSQDVYNILLKRLLANELVPGEIINRRAVAAELNVSVAPVLEAMVQLEHEGYLESIPRKGTRVCPIYPADVLGQLYLREAIECQAARLYCGKAVVEHEAELKELAGQCDRRSVDVPEHWEDEIRFHKYLTELSGVAVLVRQFEKVIRVNMFYSSNKLVEPVDRAERQSHEALVDLLKVHDPDYAERVIRNHVRSGKRNLFKGSNDSAFVFPAPEAQGS